MLKLPTVTLMCIDCVNVQRAMKVLETCKAKADFADVKLLTSLPTDYQHRVNIIPLNTLVAYSIFMLTKVHEYIDTPHVLIVQRDGWILNPESWDPAWLDLDYIGPLFVQYDKVGSGGFSLRKRSIMWDVAKTFPTWDGTQEEADLIQKKCWYYEDGEISLNPFSRKYKIGSPEQAADFAQGGNRNPQYFRERPFGFHRTWQEIYFKTGLVDSSDTSKTLQASYDHEIDIL